MKNQEKEFMRDHWTITYVIVFPIFFALGLIFDQLALGAGAGLLLSFVIRYYLKKKFDDDSKKWAYFESKKMKLTMQILLFVGLGALMLSVLFYFYRNLT